MPKKPKKKARKGSDEDDGGREAQPGGATPQNPDVQPGQSKASKLLKSSDTTPQSSSKVTTGRRATDPNLKGQKYSVPGAQSDETRSETGRPGSGGDSRNPGSEKRPSSSSGVSSGCSSLTSSRDTVFFTADKGHCSTSSEASHGGKETSTPRDQSDEGDMGSDKKSSAEGLETGGGVSAEGAVGGSPALIHPEAFQLMDMKEIREMIEEATEFLCNDVRLAMQGYIERQKSRHSSSAASPASSPSPPSSPPASVSANLVQAQSSSAPSSQLGGAPSKEEQKKKGAYEKTKAQPSLESGKVPERHEAKSVTSNRQESIEKTSPRAANLGVINEDENNCSCVDVAKDLDILKEYANMAARYIKEFEEYIKHKQQSDQLKRESESVPAAQSEDDALLRRHKRFSWGRFNMKFNASISVSEWFKKAKRQTDKDVDKDRPINLNISTTKEEMDIIQKKLVTSPSFITGDNSYLQKKLDNPPCLLSSDEEARDTQRGSSGTGTQSTQTRPTSSSFSEEESTNYVYIVPQNHPTVSPLPQKQSSKKRSSPFGMWNCFMGSERETSSDDGGMSRNRPGSRIQAAMKKLKRKRSEVRKLTKQHKKDSRSPRSKKCRNPDEIPDYLALFDFSHVSLGSPDRETSSRQTDPSSGRLSVSPSPRTSPVSDDLEGQSSTPREKTSTTASTKQSPSPPPEDTQPCSRPRLSSMSKMKPLLKAKHDMDTALSGDHASSPPKQEESWRDSRSRTRSTSRSPSGSRRSSGHRSRSRSPTTGRDMTSFHLLSRSEKGRLRRQKEGEQTEESPQGQSPPQSAAADPEKRDRDMFLKRFFRLVQEKNEDGVRRLLQSAERGWLNVCHSELHVTPLMMAVLSNWLEGVELLVEMGADPNTPMDLEPYWTALHLACLHGNECNTYVTVVALLEKGGNVNQISLHDLTPIDLALCTDHRHLAILYHCFIEIQK